MAGPRRLPRNQLSWVEPFVADSPTRRDMTFRERFALVTLIIFRSCRCLSQLTLSSRRIDNKHEPEGTAHEFLVTDTAVEEEALGAFKVGHNDGADLLKVEMSSLVEKYFGCVECWDDVSGAPLDVKLLRAAREVEMQFFEKMGVWAERLPKSVAKPRGGKIIQGR